MSPHARSQVPISPGLLARASVGHLALPIPASPDFLHPGAALKPTSAIEASA